MSEPLRGPAAGPGPGPVPGAAAGGADAALRRDAALAGAALPPLLLAAEHLADTVQMGGHGRRRPGSGAEFWQYRPARPGDEARLIDWRRSARGDAQILRERERESAQTLWIWVDPSASLRFSGAPGRVEKIARARLLALALAVLAARGGERVGLLGPAAGPGAAVAGPVLPRAGRAQLLPLSLALMAEAPGDAAAPDPAPVAGPARVLILSDFLADPAPLAAAVGALAARGVGGALLQVLDPAEEDFPYRGRTLFESVSGGARHDTQAAEGLRARYLARLAARRAEVAALAAQAGWLFGQHHTGEGAQGALLWLAGALAADG